MKRQKMLHQKHEEKELTPLSAERRARALASPLADEQQREALRELARRAVDRRGDGGIAPFQLTETAWAAIDALLGQADARSTTRSYAAARRQFMGWWLCTYARPFELPVPPEAIAQFIADFTNIEERPRSADADWVDAQLVEAGLKQQLGPIRYNTLKQRIAAVARWHTDADMASPIAHPLVNKTLRGARRAADERGELEPRRRTGIQRDAVHRILATCDDGTAEGVRDRALILFAWSTGGRRPSEVADANFRQLITRDEGKSFIYRLFRTKTLKPGAKARELPLSGGAAEAMRAWMALLEGSGVSTRSGPIFRGLRGPRAGRGMTAKGVGDVIRRRCDAAGLQGNFGGHSARRGWITQAWNDKLNPAEIMALSTHTSLASVMVYNEASTVQDNPAANLLEGSE